MVLIKQYQKIIARDTATISSGWKVFHLLAFAIAAITGLCTTFTFGKLRNEFGYGCILYADIAFSPTSHIIPDPITPTTTLKPTGINQTDTTATTTNTTDNNTRSGVVNPHQLHAIDLVHTKWSPTNLCEFCQFTHAVSMISAVVWAAYFFIVAKGGAGQLSDILPDPWKIVYPSLIFSAIFFVILAYSTIELQLGLSGFCEQFQPELQNQGCTEDIAAYTLQFHDTQMPFLPYLYSSISCAYVGLSAWLAQIVVLILRILFGVDFQLYLVNVFDKQHESDASTVHAEYHDEPPKLKELFMAAKYNVEGRHNNGTTEV